jgi:hypothetical protein
MEHSKPTKGVSEPSYAVHRPSSSSYHQNSREDEDEGSHIPPPYSGPMTTDMRSPIPQTTQMISYPGLPNLPYALYSPPNFTLSSDKTTITSRERRLSTYPQALISLVQSLAAIPPKPQVRILGKNADGATVDFDRSYYNFLLSYLRSFLELELLYSGHYDPRALRPLGWIVFGFVLEVMLTLKL